VKYEVTFSCGCTGFVDLIGKQSDREWKLRAAENRLCPECEKEEREKKNKALKERSQSLNLPELQGSDKQVEWAYALRFELIEKVDKYIESFKENLADHEKLNKVIQTIQTVIDYILQHKVKASYFIDRLNQSAHVILSESTREAMKYEENSVVREKERESKIEATVYPKDTNHDDIVEIQVLDKEVAVISDKNDTLIELLKSLKFKWRYGRWSRNNLNQMTGLAEERAIQLGNLLLNEGFPIRIYDEDIRQKAINGDFNPEHTRWVSSKPGEDKLYIRWFKSEDYYDKAKSLPTAVYDSPFIVVAITHYKEVLEFADLFDFKLSDGAKKLIQDHQQDLPKHLRVDPEKITHTETKDGLEQILQSEKGVLDDLKD